MSREDACAKVDKLSYFDDGNLLVGAIEAKNLINKIYDDFEKENIELLLKYSELQDLSIRIADDAKKYLTRCFELENRRCENCKYAEAVFNKWHCKNETVDKMIIEMDTESYLIVDKNFGCNKWEQKDA